MKIDNQDLGTYLADNPTGFNSVTTPTVSITQGNHTLYFIGTNHTGQDNTQFIDNVSLTNDASAPIPEPATLTLLGIGIAGIVGYGRRRGKQAGA